MTCFRCNESAYRHCQRLVFWRATVGGVNVVVEIVGVDIEITVQSNSESVPKLSAPWKMVRKNASWLLLLWLCWHDRLMGQSR